MTDEAAWARHGTGSTGPADLTADGSLPRAWVRRWEEDPSRGVLHGLDGSWVTAGELQERTACAAARLAASGLVPGDRLLLGASPSVDLVVAHVAALRLGLVIVPVSPAYGPREVEALVAGSRPAAAIVDDDQRTVWVRGAADGTVRVLGPIAELAGSTGRPEGGPTLDTAGPADPALLLFTSGTSGAPKGAVLNHGNLLAGAAALGLAWRWAPDDRLVLALPLHHLHGLGVGLYGTLLAGASAVLLPRFSVDAVLDAADRHRASLFFGVPTMYFRLAASSRIGELARLRLCVSGSAPLAADLHATMADRGGQVVLERYGMTETVILASNPCDGERRPGSVGWAMPGVRLRLAGAPGTSPDAGPGEILAKGPNVFSGYWERPGATAAAFDDDGWFHTGDIGAFDDDGYLRIVGRAKDLIITGGYNVYPREVEDVLRGHPDVVDVAVVGEPSAEWGETVAAFVVAAASVPADALDSLAAERLAPYKRPRRFEFVDELPRNELGKVVTSDLVARRGLPPGE
jgi:malonyl-CoA/methylmalonyl-CoA synthetase